MTHEDLSNDPEVRAFRPQARYFVTRFVLLRALGFIYFVAFFSLLLQFQALIGREGLLPAQPFLDAVSATSTSPFGPYFELPTLFWWNASDGFMLAICCIGLVLSLALLLGFATVPLLLALWVSYLSFVHVGQTFYGYGWEVLLLESGFLAAFLPPLWSPKPFAPPAPHPFVIFLFRWLVFRLMFGAGLIKLRGDPCWTDLTCLVYHYETQPNPHPLSWLLHQAPAWLHGLGVLFNHFVELVVPWGVFGPRRIRHVAGLLIIAFQLSLIASGNLSFLNWLTIAVTASCFDDDAWHWLLRRCGWAGRTLSLWARRLSEAVLEQRRSKALGRIVATWCVVVAMLSLNPIVNMLGQGQKMNASFDPFHLVNTYGAFGSITRKRLEVIVEGTQSELGPDAEWRAYEFACKPGAPDRPPCLVTPYHHRLQWQMWFASFGSPETDPWLVHLAAKLLEGNETVLDLVEHNPFPDQPPHYVRARVFHYVFTGFGEKGWWRRRFVAQWLRPVSKDDPELREFLAAHGWN